MRRNLNIFLLFFLDLDQDIYKIKKEVLDERALRDAGVKVMWRLV